MAKFDLNSVRESFRDVRKAKEECGYAEAQLFSVVTSFLKELLVDDYYKFPESVRPKATLNDGAYSYAGRVVSLYADSFGEVIAELDDDSEIGLDSLSESTLMSICEVVESEPSAAD